jgi:hypothetical protein
MFQFQTGKRLQTTGKVSNSGFHIIHYNNTRKTRINRSKTGRNGCKIGPKSNTFSEATCMSHERVRVVVMKFNTAAAYALVKDKCRYEMLQCRS